MMAKPSVKSLKWRNRPLEGGTTSGGWLWRRIWPFWAVNAPVGRCSKCTGSPQDDSPGVPKIRRDMMAKPSVKSLKWRNRPLEGGTTSGGWLWRRIWPFWAVNAPVGRCTLVSVRDRPRTTLPGYRKSAASTT